MQAVRFLRRAQLRVAPDVGAGLELFPCERGFLVEEVDCSPGQPDLKAKDVIVAIGVTPLFGLEAEEIEHHFGAGFHDGANVIVGEEAAVAQLSLEALKRATEFLLDPIAAELQPCVDPIIEAPPGLCAFDADDGVEVHEDRAGASCRCLQAETWSGVRGRPGMLKGMYQYEVEVVGACLLRVGFATIAAKRALGKDGRSFGYGGTGMKSTGGNFEAYGEKFNGDSGAVVTCLLDRRDPEHQTISFCVNGSNQGVAFDIPVNMADLPLFPALCGRGSWSAICRFEDLTFPADGYAPLAEALQAGDAIAGPQGASKPPPGLPACEAHNLVQPGQRVALYVHIGSWQGWHPCQVVDVDALGCYLRHEEDNYTETIPWLYLSGGQYRLELLPQKEVSTEAPSHDLDDLRSSFSELQSIFLQVATKIPETVRDKIDATLNPKEQAFIMWLASNSSDQHFDFHTSQYSDTNFASSFALKEWLHALQLSAHADAISTWCKEQGAVCLSELVENRQELAGAMNNALSPTECSRLLSQAAEEAAEGVALRSHSSELASLLGTVVAQIEHTTFETICSDMTSTGKALLLRARPAALHDLSESNGRCNASASRSTNLHGVAAVPEKESKGTGSIEARTSSSEWIGAD